MNYVLFPVLSSHLLDKMGVGSTDISKAFDSHQMSGDYICLSEFSSVAAIDATVRLSVICRSFSVDLSTRILCAYLAGAIRETRGMENFFPGECERLTLFYENSDGYIDGSHTDFNKVYEATLVIPKFPASWSAHMNAALHKTMEPENPRGWNVVGNDAVSSISAAGKCVSGADFDGNYLYHLTLAALDLARSVDKNYGMGSISINPHVAQPIQPTAWVLENEGLPF